MKIIINRFLNLKFRYKLLLSYITVILISMIIVSFVNYHISVSVMESKTTDYSNTIISQVSTNLDFYMKDLEKIIFIKYNNTPLVKYLKGEGDINQDNNQITKSIKWNNLLFDTLYSESYYQSVFIVNKDLQFHYLDKDGNARNIELEVDTEKDSQYLKSLWGRCWWVKKDDETVYVKRAIFDINSSKYLGYIVIGIKSSYLKSIYENTDLTQGGRLVILDSRNNILLNDDNKSVAVAYAFLENNSENDKETTIKYNGEKYLCTLKVHESKELKVLNIIPAKYLTKSWDTLKYWIVGACLFSLFIAMLLAFLISNNISENVSLLLKSIRSISEGHFDRRIVPKSQDEIGLLAKEFNSMSEKIIDLMLKIKNEEVLKKDAEYKVLEFKYNALQSQINPHFLYNTLDTINSLAKIKGEFEISHLVCLLGKLLRLSISRKSKELRLSEELDYIRKYLEIYQTVYRDNIEVRYDLNSELKDALVPNFILQPIVENAIVHGIENKYGKGIIAIRSRKLNNNLILEVYDNGIGIEKYALRRLLSSENVEQVEHSQTNMHLKVGINSVIQRIKLLYGNEFGIKIDSEYGRYTKVQLIIPLIFNKESETYDV